MSFVLLILAVIAISGCTSDTKTFSANGVTFEYPSQWSQLSANQVTTDTVAYVYNATDDNIVFTVRKLENYNSLADAVNGFKTKNTNSPTFSLVSEKDVTVNGLKGHEFIYTFASSTTGAKMKDKAILLEKTPGTTYFLIGESPFEHYDQFEPVFNNIINSFKVQ